jgi:hypothetical protein
MFLFVMNQESESCRLFLSGWLRTPHGGSGIVHSFVVQLELLMIQKSGQFPDEPVRITV